MNEFTSNFKDRNETRTRFYGLRIGDIVSKEYFCNIKVDTSVLVEVVGYGGSDNNLVYIRDESGNVIKSTAERLTLHTKVEDIKEGES